MFLIQGQKFISYLSFPINYISYGITQNFHLFIIHNNTACLHKKLNMTNKHENEHDSLKFIFSSILKVFFCSYWTFEYLTQGYMSCFASMTDVCKQLCNFWCNGFSSTICAICANGIFLPSYLHYFFVLVIRYFILINFISAISYFSTHFSFILLLLILKL